MSWCVSFDYVKYTLSECNCLSNDWFSLGANSLVCHRSSSSLNTLVENWDIDISGDSKEKGENFMIETLLQKDYLNLCCNAMVF